MPTYKNVSVKTITYNGTVIRPNDTLSIAEYLDPYYIAEGLQLIDHEPAVSPVLVSFNGAITSGSEEILSVPWTSKPIEIRLFVVSGSVTLYFNTTSTNAINVYPNVPFITHKLDCTIVNRLIVQATSDSTISLSVIEHIR